MKSLADLKLLILRPFLQNLKNPTWLVVGLSVPIMYLLLFMPLLNRLAGGPGFPTSHVIQLFLPGILALLAFGSATGVGFGMIFWIRNGFIERMRVTPANRFALLMGPVFSGIAWSLIFITLILVISLFFGFKIHLVGLLIFALLLILLMAIFASFFTSLAIIAKGQISTLAAIANGINLPILLLAGVMLPLTLAPHWMRILAYINPLYYVVSAGRALAIGQIGVHSVELAFTVMIPLTALVVWWSMRIYKKAVA
ncbi:MAG TPA: ABC transporter permease [Candidatus Saccharimonadales bacterium]|nr:ABC transporter permease [Candidatus Saccharimonadales bacterium]